MRHLTVLIALVLGIAGCSSAPQAPRAAAASGGGPAPSTGGRPASPSPDFGASDAAALPLPPGCAALPLDGGPSLALQLAQVDVRRDVVFAPSGAVFATSGMFGNARIWDGKTGQLRLSLDGTDHHVANVAFDATSSWVAAIAGQEVVAWQLETGRRRPLFRLPELTYDVSIAPSGRTLATTHKGTLRTWSLEGAALASMPIGVEAAAFSPDGSRLLSWERSVFVDKTVTLWDPATGAKLWTRSGAKGSSGGDAAFRPDGTEVAWIPEGSSIDILDAKTGAVKRSLRGARDLDELAWGASPAGPRVLGLTKDGHLIVWDATTGQRIASQQNASFSALDVSGDGRRAGIRRGYEGVSLVDVSAPQSASEVPIPGDVTNLALSPREKRIAVVGQGRAPTVVDLLDGRGVKGVLPMRDVVEMSLSPDGATLAAMALVQVDGNRGDLEVRFIDARTGSLRGTLDTPPGTKASSTYRHVRYSPAGDRIVATSLERVDFFGPSGRFERTAEAHPKFHGELPVAFSRDGRRLAVAGGPRDTVRIYDPGVGLVAEHEGRIGRIWSMAFDPGRGRIALGSTGQIAILDVASGAEIARLRGEFRGVEAMVWRDERTLFTANQTGSIARATLGGAVEIFAAHGTARARSIAISPDGKLLATGGEDKALRVWDPTTMQPVAVSTFEERGPMGVHFHPRAPIVFASGGPIRVLRPSDGGALSIFIVGSGRDLGGLAVSAGGLFGGDEKAFAAVRFSPGNGRASQPLAWFDAFPALRRPALVDDLARGCPVGRRGQAAP